VQLPPAVPRRQARVPRGLKDDGQALPPLPRLPLRPGSMAGLHLRLVQGEQDPAHWIWNRLVVREHPLGRRPLVGAQLRYLIECDQGILAPSGLARGVSPGVPGSMDWLGFAGPAAEFGQSDWAVSFFAPAWITRAELGFPVLRSGVAAGGAGLASPLWSPAGAGGDVCGSGCVITDARWPRPIGGGWARAKGEVEMIGGVNTVNRPRTFGFMN